MNVFFRVDASISIGTGHVMRCLSLAEELRARGASISFLCRKLTGDLCGQIEQKGFPVYRISDGDSDVERSIAVLQRESAVVDWLIVDHYGLDAKWERRVRPYVKKLLVIDDLANRPHDCDLLLDQNIYEQMESRYDQRVPPHCIKLLGPRFALLRTEFREVRKQMRQRHELHRIFIFFGGSDPTNETRKALEAIQAWHGKRLAVDVVVGGINPHKEQIRHFCASLPHAQYHCQIPHIAALMARADLAICAGGTVTWERFCLGLPAIVIAVAENQMALAQNTHQLGIDCYLGRSADVTPERIQLELSNLAENSSRLMQAGRRAIALVDGYGVSRVITHMKELLHERVKGGADIASDRSDRG
ncbi:UDP-2,4-diacetamido-2,4,6-trideoxy-beta-L-altropyranose hydrolase [Brevibacillus humidisoli]|uniref:UDP-2,4-diacetamido-2,4, 6-trideoxy-beta-L-altropyranose hydrolase n=1 Tax=Brevibacillus humidisoli TaxID=2895522 RepID=UPI001E43B6FB|nr:UDP-2,4-diacetamido-2,4,6-trideoxy-beta-L-altropyranose hydrolase [Brevibacillus humidisoli]UFJ42528.1 UDP-2,4-diacetamido-2,4,6-trideoxy-beta-L-altropyranose hydrolase [Brevibacillus humidisoli]